MTFDEAFAKMIAHEGGFIDHRADPGGATKYGISKRSYPMLDIAALTLDDAKTIYRRDFWGPAGCDAVPDALKFDLFDTAVHSGVGTAVRMLQRVVGETADGILGPRTLQAVQSMTAPRLVARFNGARLALMADLPHWPSFGRGWARRIAANLQAV
jgi:lysozyme family protein